MLSALAGAACGDPALCDSTPLIAIQAPTSGVTVDGDAAAPGVQSDIRVRSTLVDGDELLLEVIDSSGTVVVTQRKPAGEGGETVFTGVTLPIPKAKIRTSWQGACGTDSDEVEIDVVAGAGCEVQLTPGPVSMPTYPVGVLNQDRDPGGPSTPGFKAEVVVATRADWAVQLYATTGGGPELPVGEATVADAMGLSKYDQTLLDGLISFRAVCRGPGNQSQPSASVSAFVDTTAPSCDFTRPLRGTTITPGFDLDGNITNGVQLALEAFVGGGDVAGQGVDLEVFSEEDGTTIVPMMPVDPQGRTTAMLTLQEYVYELKISTTDRAGNSCLAPRDYEVEYNGCDVSVLGPTAAVKVDADGVPGNGSQLDVQLMVGTACVGQTVTTTNCGLSASAAGTVQPSGQATVRVTMCGTSPCETQPTHCTFSVSKPASPMAVVTRAAALLTFDNAAPAVDLQIVQPAVPCGAELMPVDDIDPATPGVQVVARVTAPGAIGQSLELNNAAGTVTLAMPTDRAITLQPGFNTFTGIAYDVHDNRGETSACAISLATPAATSTPAAKLERAARPAGASRAGPTSRAAAR